MWHLAAPTVYLGALLSFLCAEGVSFPEAQAAIAHGLSVLTGPVWRGAFGSLKEVFVQYGLPVLCLWDLGLLLSEVFCKLIHAQHQH